MENTVNNLGYHSKTTLPHFQQCALACQDYNRLSFLLLGHRFIAIGQPVCLSFPWWEWGKRGYQMKLKEHFPYLIKNTDAWTENKPKPLPEDRKLSQEKKKKKQHTDQSGHFQVPFTHNFIPSGSLQMGFPKQKVPRWELNVPQTETKVHQRDKVDAALECRPGDFSRVWCRCCEMSDAIFPLPQNNSLE